MNVLFVFGTRPEAIKMAPVIDKFKQSNSFNTTICVSGQQRHLLDSIIKTFDIEPDYDLDIMIPGSTLTSMTGRLLIAFESVLDSVQPDLVFVHGDTLTTLTACLGAFYKKIDVAHIEAGLRTGDIYDPWPEELNRKIAGTISRWHFASTNRACDALINENVNENQIFVTGNTVIDSLKLAVEKVNCSPHLLDKYNSIFSLHPDKKLIIVTVHRRENFGLRIRDICRAINELSKREDVQIIFPVHPNPSVKTVVEEELGNAKNISLIDPLDYLPFIYLLQHAYLVLTDSGGLQEEAPTLGKPVLVLRDVTERPEAVFSGTVRLVGSNASTIIEETTRLLEDPKAYKEMSRSINPYGDGFSSSRIFNIITDLYRRSGDLD